MAERKILSESERDGGRVQRQVKLPFLKSVEISIKSIKVRFFRSLITTMSLVLAVSFLSFVGVSNDIANGMLAKQDPELRRILVRSGYGLIRDKVSHITCQGQRCPCRGSRRVCFLVCHAL